MSMVQDKYKSRQKYNHDKTKSVTLRLVVNTEQDIIQKLESVPNKNGYIKALIRADIANSKT